MKGLFVKDIELMKQQKQFFVLVVVMGVKRECQFCCRIFYDCHSNFCHYDYKL